MVVLVASTGRTREVEALLPLPVALGLLLAAAVGGFALGGVLAERLLAGRPSVRRLAFGVGALLYAAVVLQGTFALLLAHRLAREPAEVRELYGQAIGAGTEGGLPASSAYFRGHPYLNFALNPDAAYMGERQFNATYLIRRKEPVRPRREVAWRALALGGSTTFGEGTAREEDTWVYRLEQKLRQLRGPGCDVINGGVGGYNVVDNLIHYLLLLDALGPDVVVLYVGINDIHPRLMGTLARDYSNSRIPWRAEANTLPVANSTLLPLNAYRYLVLREIERRRFAHIYAFVQHPFPPVGEWAAALARNGPDVFRAHLENLVRLIRAQARSVILVPQVFSPLGSGDDAFAQGVREHNAVAEAVAREFRVPFMGELTTAIGRRDLRDNCHFNRRGHETMAKLLFRRLRDELPATGASRPETAEGKPAS